jgi:hypothetical protein
MFQVLKFRKKHVYVYGDCYSCYRSGKNVWAGMRKDRSEKYCEYCLGDIKKKLKSVGFGECKNCLEESIVFSVPICKSCLN